ncbi:hypothetical protein [uncultured Sphingomonas sp.]|uniref:hypothetical protein n=1 Tax=uncultured Sphingomonas sp. TaxID=158754 RepID=UPI0035CC7FF7
MRRSFLLSLAFVLAPVCAATTASAALVQPVPSTPADTAPAQSVPTRPASSAPPASSSTVVVTARRLPPAKMVEHLTHAVTQSADASEALARFPDMVCPSSEGMPLDYDARIVARIRADAAAAAIGVDKPGCHPNVIVMVVPNGQAVVRALRRTQSYIFGDMEPHQIAEMAADAGPVHAWTVTRRRSRDADTERVGTMMQDVPEIQVRDASIILAATRLDMTASVLLIDVDAVIGKTVNQIADYAAMRTLAPTRPAGTGHHSANPDDTILGLFAPGDPAGRPRGLTGFDAGYLKALYHGPATERGMAKMGQMVRSIAAASPPSGAAPSAATGSMPSSAVPAR